MNNSDACIILNLISGIGYAKYSNLLEYFKSQTEILSASSSELQQVQGIGKELARYSWRK